jgi:hypothetical protein
MKWGFIPEGLEGPKSPVAGLDPELWVGKVNVCKGD